MVEHRLNDLDDISANVYKTAILAASKDDLRDTIHAVTEEVNRRFESIHRRFDDEVNPAIKDLGHRRFVRDWLVGVSLFATIVYSIAMTIKIFVL